LNVGGERKKGSKIERETGTSCKPLGEWNNHLASTDNPGRAMCPMSVEGEHSKPNQRGRECTQTV